MSETGDPEERIADVPQVVTGVGAEVNEFVRADRFFGTDDERRGFLREGADPEAVREAGGRIEDPSVGDMCNFYVYLDGENRLSTVG